MKGTMLPPLSAISLVAEGRVQSGLASSSSSSSSPQSLPQAQEKGCFRRLLGADDVAGPGLVLGARRQVRDDHLHGLQLLVLGRDGAHLIGDLVAFHGDVLPFHIRDMQEDVGTAVSRGDEAVALGSTEALADPFVDGALGGPHRRGEGPRPASGQRAGDHIAPERGW